MRKVTDANVSDYQIAIELLTEVSNWHITIQLVCADAAYREELEDWFILLISVNGRLHLRLDSRGLKLSVTMDS